MQSNCYSLKNFTSIDEKILYICANEYTEFFKKPNVVGMGLGYKTTSGFDTKEKCIKVLVSIKIPTSNLNSNDIVPKFYKGIKTDVYESGILKFSSLKKRVRPVVGGCSIGISNISKTGSLGCLVMDNSNYYILSCNHVMANYNTTPLGTAIIQPALCYGGNPSRDTIGRLCTFIPLQYSSPTKRLVNYVDAALAKISDLSLVSNDIYGLGAPLPPINASLDLSVRKAGSSTSITYGYIKLLGATVRLQSTKYDFIFKDQLLATTMGESGDSGALVMDLNNHSVGLFIGGTNSSSVITPINTILNALSVRIPVNNY